MLLALGCAMPLGAAERPNVLLVITDDQGFGDLGVTGNPVVRTPNIDQFAKQSAWLKHFYVCPVCSPTRSSLMTGLYNYRTGVVDTFIGRSMMRPGIPTLPEQLAASGYRTGLFGKWHLGDNYPMRPEDRGFQQTLWHHGGGLAQPSDAPGTDPKTAYFNPTLTRNGREVKTSGYCTDVFTDAAIDFIRADAKKPFFAYVAYNCPHGPFEVPAKWSARYHKLDLSPAAFPKIGQPWAGRKLNTDAIADAYGMIENIDANFARLLKAVGDDTLVIFMTDNGPGGVRFNAGLRNRKGTVYEGGVRVPCYVRWPGKTRPGQVVEQPAAHIDLAPTLLHACGAKTPTGLDGRDISSLLKGEKADWPDRTLFFQWHRGDAPEKFRAFAARGPRYKLVQAAGVPENAKWTPKFELFDLQSDPFEEHDLAAKLPDEVAKLKNQYADWFADVTKKGFAPPRIVLGSGKENPVRLSRQDWRGPQAGWKPGSLGYWAVRVERAGEYEVTLLSREKFDGYSLSCSEESDNRNVIALLNGTLAGGKNVTPFVRNRAIHGTRVKLTLKKADARIEAEVERSGKKRGVDYVEVKYIGAGK
jgi:arylsulfatase A-like enzyme